jgi:hypothetical protein
VAELEPDEFEEIDESDDEAEESPGCSSKWLRA